MIAVSGWSATSTSGKPGTPCVATEVSRIGVIYGSVRRPAPGR
jgi:hypothetical protein